MKESKVKREELKMIQDYLQDIVNNIQKEIGEYSHVFTKDEVIQLGWVYHGFYPAGNEHFYTKNNKMIRVPRDDSFSYILTYDGRPMRQIQDVEELEDYAK